MGLQGEQPDSQAVASVILLSLLSGEGGRGLLSPSSQIPQRGQQRKKLLGLVIIWEGLALTKLAACARHHRLCVISLNLHSTPRTGCSYYPYLTNEETEAQGLNSRAYCTG